MKQFKTKCNTINEKQTLELELLKIEDQILESDSTKELKELCKKKEQYTFRLNQLINGI